VEINGALIKTLTTNHCQIWRAFRGLPVTVVDTVREFASGLLRPHFSNLSLRAGFIRHLPGKAPDTTDGHANRINDID